MNFVKRKKASVNTGVFLFYEIFLSMLLKKNFHTTFYRKCRADL